MSDRDLILTANTLSRRAPDEWNRFVAAFESYAVQRMSECVSAEISMLAVAQGRAQACALLLGHLKECQKQADSIIRRASPNANQP